MPVIGTTVPLSKNPTELEGNYDGNSDGNGDRNGDQNSSDSDSDHDLGNSNHDYLNDGGDSNANMSIDGDLS